MNLRTLTLLPLFVATILVAAAKSHAANITVVNGNPECLIALTGEIVPGDAAAFRSLAEATPTFLESSGEYLNYANVCLDSNGGNFLEGVRIARYITDTGIGTVVENGARCLSACAIAFMAGRTLGDEFDGLRRKLHHRGVLGFHRPYFPAIANGTYSSGDVNRAVQLTADALLEFMRLANTRIAFDQFRLFSPTLVESILEHRGNEFLYIDTVDKAGRWKIKIYGVEFPRSLSHEMVATACENLIHWHGDIASPGSDAATLQQRISTDPAAVPEGLNGQGFRHSLGVSSSRAGLLGSGCNFYVKGPPERLSAYRICAQDDGLDVTDLCQGEDFDSDSPSDDAIYLFPPSQLLSTLPPARSADQPKLASVTASQHKIQAMLQAWLNTDVSGQDISILKNSDENQCQSNCAKLERCVAATFDRWNRLCILKDRVTEMRINAKSDSWIREGITPRPATYGMRMYRRKERAFPDDPYRRIAVDSYDACTATCLKDSKCMGVTYQHAGQCGLIDRPSEYLPNTASDVAYKVEGQ